MFPLNTNFNRGAYKTTEDERGYLTKPGAEVRVNINLDGGTADRPAEISVKYGVVDPKTGEAVYSNRVTFDNQAGQSFDRVSLRDMRELLK